MSEMLSKPGLYKLLRLMGKINKTTPLCTIIVVL